MRLTTVDLRFVGTASDSRRALVKEAVRGVNFAARGGVVDSLAFPVVQEERLAVAID